MMNSILLRITVALVAATSTVATAAVRLPAMFSDHAVLQADKAVNMWGWASEGETVTVTIAGATATTVAKADGTWSVALAPLPVGGPFVMEVAGSNALTVNDVLIGEVWLCAGQSNMAMQLKGLHGEVDDADAVIAKADHPTLRMFVHDDPVSLRDTAVPPAQPLADRPGRWIVCTPATAAKFTAMGYFFARHLQDELNAPVGLINTAVGGTTIEAWTSLSAQRDVPVLQPMLVDWRQRLESYDPVAEQRDAVAAKAAWYTARAEAVKANRREPKAPRKADYKNLTANGPGGLFNAMIAPVIPYTLRGALWYQGERNASGPFTTVYGQQLETLITDWRSRWADSFHVVCVQLPSYGKAQESPADDVGWGVWVREGQRRVSAALPAMSMPVTIDLGGSSRAALHPTNKDEFARRAALLVLHDVYGKSNPARQGPTYRSHRREGSRLILSFDFAEGLAGNTDASAPNGFAIAGSDQNFVWANVVIRDSQVIVWHDDVPEPQAVRYNWAGNPIGDLINAAVLPAGPFRTDDW
ncbi:MAG TPA: sialate O-acetylesterase [Tepidisphaeraceae bacterium]|jgi:sialate O-acetylesterase|nr:sialate O-acetylesterase [Tepidisphaeraceae bacterium]